MWMMLVVVVLLMLMMLLLMMMVLMVMLVMLMMEVPMMIMLMMMQASKLTFPVWDSRLRTAGTFAPRSRRAPPATVARTQRNTLRQDDGTLAAAGLGVPEPGSI